jgi:hypothetical protein
MTKAELNSDEFKSFVSPFSVWAYANAKMKGRIPHDFMIKIIDIFNPNGCSEETLVTCLQNIHLHFA